MRKHGLSWAFFSYSVFGVDMFTGVRGRVIQLRHCVVVTLAYLTFTITPELWLLYLGRQYQSIIHP